MKMQSGLSMGLVVLVVLALLAIIIVLNYNGLVKAEKDTEEAKAQIETVLQRRLDLVPNLVATVKGYAAHERETLAAVVKARAEAQSVLKTITSKKSLGKDDMSALSSSQAMLTGSLHNLIALVENYPELRAGSKFLALQDQLEGTENRISVARQRYNYAANVLNTKINIFPSNLIAAGLGFEEKGYFEAKEEASVPVKVQF